MPWTKFNRIFRTTSSFPLTCHFHSTIPSACCAYLPKLSRRKERTSSCGYSKRGAIPFIPDGCVAIGDVFAQRVVRYTDTEATRSPVIAIPRSRWGLAPRRQSPIRHCLSRPSFPLDIQPEGRSLRLALLLPSLCHPSREIHV